MLLAIEFVSVLLIQTVVCEVHKVVLNPSLAQAVLLTC